MTNRFRRLVFSCLLGLVLNPPGLSANELRKTDIVGLDFQDLASIKVTSVSKKEDRLMETPAAVYVITGEDIRRSGATTLAEALRLAPGLDVAHLNGPTWAISSRGFNGIAANKLLVMMDNRSVYTPLFSGVFWDAQDVLMDNIDRIEVIRGPGASVWGSNAVNGVINIIRKHAAETQGGRVIAGGGTEERGFGALRYGGEAGSKGYYRATIKHSDRDDMRLTTGGEAQDAWRFSQAGFRADLGTEERDTFSMTADAYSGEENQFANVNTLTPPFRTTVHDQTYVAGGNAMAAWTRHFSSASHLHLQTYFDHTNRNINPIFAETRDTYDIELQHRFPLAGIHDLIWGGGARVSDDSVSDQFGLNFAQNSDLLQNYDVFFQDEMKLHRKFLLTVGSKFEYHDYTGLEVQPNIRGSWLVNRQNTIWTAVSRAVRTPTRYDRDIRVSAVISSAPLSILSFRGTTDFGSEEVTAYEAGWRSKPSQRVFFDLAAFYNRYDHLMGLNVGAPFTSPNGILVFPSYFNNKVWGESFGAEIAPQVQVAEWWRAQLQYSYLHLRLHLEGDNFETILPPPFASPAIANTETNNPTHQASLRNSFNLPHAFELDLGVRYVDELHNLRVGSYTVGDARLGWRGIRNLNLEVIGQNLLMSHHLEFRPGNEVERSVYGRATWDF